MNSKQFFKTVVEMRKAQREYFRTHTKASLRNSMRLEDEIDAEIKRVEALGEKEQNKEQKFL
jgi:hypothetical protein